MSKPIDLGLDSDENHPRRLVALPNDENHLLAFGGNDGTISIIDLDTSNVQVARQFDDSVRDIAFSYDGKRVAVGLDDGSTQIFYFPDFDTNASALHPFVIKKAADEFLPRDVSEPTFQGPRFDAPVRSLQWDPRSYVLAIASEAGMCIVDGTSKDTMSSKDRFLQEAADREHSMAGVRGISYFSTDSQTLLASIGLDGRLCVWVVTGDDPASDYGLLHRDNYKCVSKADIGELNGSDALDRSCLPVFGENFLCLPGKSDVQLRSTLRFDQQFLLSSPDTRGHIEAIVALTVTNDNKSIVTSGRDGRVNLWAIETKDSELSGHFVRMLRHFDSVPTHMIWKSKSLYLAHADGTLSTLPMSEIFPTSISNENDSAKVDEKKSMDTSYDSDNNEDDLTHEKKMSRSMDDEDDNNDSRHGDDMDAFLDDDVPVSSLSRARIELPEPQPAFAPSSTPLDLPRRIMCWNHIGTCTLLRGEDGNLNNTVSIDFTDSAFRRPVTFTDNMHFILGSLGEDGGIFATDLEDDDHSDDDVGQLVDGLNMSDRTKAAVRRSHSMKKDNDSGKSTGSRIYFHRFETFGSLRDKDWYLTLPDGERAMGCATGEGWAAVATSRRFLRLFSSGGNQGPILWLKGEPVAVVGRSRFLAVIYHEAIPLPDGTQKFGFLLYDTKANRLITSGSLACISSRSSLLWTGFSNDCSLLVMDSSGLLSMLISMDLPGAKKDGPGNLVGYTWEWSPVLDTFGLRKSVDDSFWPVTSYDGKLVCVPLKGGNDYPDARRRPVTTTLSFRMPFSRGTLGNTSILEEASLRASLALTQKRFLNDMNAADGFDTEDMEAEYDQLCANVDKVTLKLFHTVVTAGKLERALDLCARLHLEKSFDIATRVADMANHRKLADHIDDAKEKRFPAQTESLEDNQGHGNFGSQAEKASNEEAMSQRISPEYTRLSKRPLDKISEGGPSDVEETQICKNRKANPFAKKSLESPSRKKSTYATPHRSPSKSIALSRLSSFSAKSRNIQSSKNIM